MVWAVVRPSSSTSRREVAFEAIRKQEGRFGSGFDRGQRRRVTNTIVSAPASPPCIDHGKYLPFLILNLRSFLYVSPSRLVADIQGDLVVRTNGYSTRKNVYCIAVAVSPSIALRWSFHRRSALCMCMTVRRRFLGLWQQFSP